MLNTLGDGFVEAVDDQTLLAIAANQPRLSNGLIRGEAIEVPIYWRSDLSPGAQLSGPAVIAEDETSTVVSGLFEARIDGFGYIHLVRKGI